jgi:very-short-patch-repair endonuclease
VNSQRGSSVEKIVVKMLDSLQIKFEPQKVISLCIVDMYIPEINGVLFVDGDYWHQRLMKQIIKDQKVERMLRGWGYKVLRLRDIIILNDKELALKMIRDFVDHPEIIIEKCTVLRVF